MHSVISRIIDRLVGKCRH